MRGQTLLSVSDESLQDEAAWELLQAIRKLFHTAFDELLSLDGRRDNRLLTKKKREHLRHSIEEWTQRHNISCEAVNEVAFSYLAEGRIPTRKPMRRVEFDRSGKRIEFPTLTPPWPDEESLNAFVERARLYYAEVSDSFEKRGYTKRPVKRESAHFEFLAAHLVGGMSWADISRDDTSRWPCKTQQTVAGEARKAARLIGIALPTSRGPRPGSRSPRRQNPPRRAR